MEMLTKSGWMPTNDIEVKPKMNITFPEISLNCLCLSSSDISLCSFH